MHSTIRYATRAALFPLAAIAGLSGIAATSDSAEAAPKPKLDVRVRHRTLFVEGGRAADVITLRRPAGTPHLLAIDLGDDGSNDVRVHRNRFDDVVVRGGDGDDVVRIDETAGVALPFTDLTPTSIRGNDGDDTLLGGSGIESFRGGAGDDVVDGSRGNDIAVLGAGDDEFIWDPGDGSDSIEGRRGEDVMTFNGSNDNETFTAVANGNRLRFTRNLGNIVMDSDDVERVDLRALGGSDFIEIDPLGATDVHSFEAEVEGVEGSGNPDGIIDSIFFDGTSRSDAVTITGADGDFVVDGLAPRLAVTNADRFDHLLVSTSGGADAIDATAFGDNSPHLSVLAGAGNDVVLGGTGDDGILAGGGRDVVDGNRGSDTADLDGGDDEFIWDPGDGSDTIRGASGHDTLTFNGSSGDEALAAFSLGGRLGFTRDLGSIFMDSASVEQLDVNALGGADTFTMDDLSDTGVNTVDANLAGSLGGVGGDGAVDALTVLGTPNDDFVDVSGGNGSVQIEGLDNRVDIVNAEPTDTLTVDGNGGEDLVFSDDLAPGTIDFLIAP